MFGQRKGRTTCVREGLKRKPRREFSERGVAAESLTRSEAQGHAPIHRQEITVHLYFHMMITHTISPDPVGNIKVLQNYAAPVSNGLGGQYVNWGNSSAGVSIGLKPIGVALTVGSVLLKRLLPGTLIPAPASFVVPVNAGM